MKKILLIEDDEIMRENIAELMQLSGYETETAENGKIGVEKAKTFLPDLIICDIAMPELDGYGVLYLLGKSKETESIPFIFLTARSEKTDRRKGMNMGADDFLIKPFNDVELLNAVESRLKKHEIVKKKYESDKNGIYTFLKEAGQLLSLEHITKNYQGSTYKAKDILFRKGDFAHFLYFINGGKVKTYRLNDDGKEFITGIYECGDFFGYQPLLEDRSYIEFAETMEESEVYKMPKDDFLSLIYKNREVANRFVRMISKDLSTKEAELMHLAYSSVRKRVARKLQEIIENKEDNHTTISRSDLANLIGTSKETLVRILSEFKEDKIIDTDGSKVIMLDMNKLKALEKVY